MKSEWKEFRLGDITEWASGGTPSKQNADFWNGTIPWISASSMGSNRYNESDLKITQDGLKAGSRIAKKDSILLLVRGSTLHQRIPVGIATTDVSFNQDVKAITVKEEFIDPWYLLFWFMAKEKDLLNMVENTGIGAGKLDTKRLQDMLIKIPPSLEQKRIRQFAKALDDKLLLNRQINQILESMTQTIFKSWFVDFEPVKAKIAAIEAGEDAKGITSAAIRAISGKTEDELSKMQAAQPEKYAQLKNTAELFPSAMQDSEELGKVPEGWGVGKIGDLAEIQIGGDWGDEKEFKDSVQVICLRGVDLEKIKENGYSQEAPFRWVRKNSYIKRKISNQDILIGGSGLGPIGRSIYFYDGINDLYKVPTIYSNFCKRLTAKTSDLAIYIEKMLEDMHVSGEIKKAPIGAI